MGTYDDSSMKFQPVTVVPRIPLWIGVAAVVLLAGEAALQASWGWLAMATLAAAFVAVAAFVGDRRTEGRGLALGLMAMAGLLGIATWRSGRVALQPARVAANAVQDAVAVRDRELRAAIAGANRIARLALSRVDTSALGTPHSLGDLLSGSDIERAIVVLGGDTVLAVSGPQRVPPKARRAPILLVSTSFTRLLVVRAVQGHREGQVTLLVDAAPGVPVANSSLADLAGGWNSLAWAWTMPRGEQEFQTSDAAVTAIRATMQPVSPNVSNLVVREARLARWLTGAGLAILAVVILLTASHPAARAGALLLPLWALIRSDVDTGALGLPAIKALLAAVALLIVAVVLWRKPMRRSAMGLAASLLLLGTAPPLIVMVARFVVPKLESGSLITTLGWEVSVALVAAGLLAVATAPLRTPGDEEASRVWGLAATFAAAIVGAVGVVAWTPRGIGGWPLWYIPLWAIPLLLMLPTTSRRTRRLAVATCAAVLAALATWGASLDSQIGLARADLDRLAATSDTVTAAALDSFAIELKRAHVTRLDDLYAAWRASALERDGIPTHLAVFGANGQARENVALDELSVTWEQDLIPMVRAVGDTARRVGMPRGYGHHEVLIVPVAPDTILTVAVGPRSRLIAPSRFGRLVGWRSPAQPQYSESVVSDDPGRVDTTVRRAGRFVRQQRLVTAGNVPRVVRAVIEMSREEPYAVRAALLVLLDVGAILALWLAILYWLGDSRRLSLGVLRRSYRRSLATTLAAFFIVPATLFTLWSVVWVRQDATQERLGEVRRTLAEVADVGNGFGIVGNGGPSRDSLARTADSVDAEVAIYRKGRLLAASTGLLAELGILPPVLDPSVRPVVGAAAISLPGSFPGIGVRLGIEATAPSGTLVVAALPGGGTDLALEQIELALLLLLAVLGGTAAAVVVADTVAHALGHPIDMLRRTALAIGRREPVPEVTDVPSEFEPVFNAIHQMEQDLRESTAELEAGRLRTAAILSTVATGVIGVDATGAVIHANPRALEILGRTITVGMSAIDQLPPSWKTVGAGIVRLIGSTTRTPESREVEVGERRFAVTLAPLGDGGLVLAITDITEASRAARVLAWGEMARQVAHEIKNPLTPMRLGLQHLRRVRADNNPDFPALVEETTQRLLSEIDRLDRIARSFARYGTPPAGETSPLESIDLRAIGDEIAGLFQLSSERPTIEVVGEGPRMVLARKEELVQVLLNLLDNARQAGASRVRLLIGDSLLRVEDDGQGVPAEQLGRIFEPSFSTNTSGTGLGLAIVRRLVEGWGATIGVASMPPRRGATFTIQFPGGGQGLP